MGTILMQELISRVRGLGLRHIVAGSSYPSKDTTCESVLFHQKMGFKIVGTFKEMLHKFDQWLDLTFLQLDLELDKGTK